MLEKLKSALFVILTLVALIASMIFLGGCAKQAQAQKVDINMRELIEMPSIYTDQNATNEQEASLMAWDLYQYIRELENALRACKGLN